MTFQIEIDYSENDIFNLKSPILSTLLLDHSSGKNIIWATDNYEYLGSRYSAKSEIFPELITGSNNNVIQPRVTKAASNKISRTREKAEVFTPSWVCNVQNNLFDDGWFGKKGIFNNEVKNGWETNYEKIVFPNEKNKDWKHYVDLKRLEMTCGEAPYLVSRYDSVTGKSIDLKERIGVLDRKMRVISENTCEIKDWIYWVHRAFQSTYGFEYQGDNLLLARENLFLTFVEYFHDKFDMLPTDDLQNEICKIISWNMWQMDGTTFSVPFGNLEDSYVQTTLESFENDFKTSFTNKEKKSPPCKIKDWRSKKEIIFNKLVRHVL